MSDTDDVFKDVKGERDNLIISITPIIDQVVILQKRQELSKQSGFYNEERDNEIKELKSMFLKQLGLILGLSDTKAT